MLGVGVGLGVYKLEPPREQDELPPVIFLNAPETFRPMPFMMEQKHVQLEMGYVSEMKMKLLPTSCSAKYVINLAAKKWERERESSCNQTWAKIQRKPKQECNTLI